MVDPILLAHLPETDRAAIDAAREEVERKEDVMRRTEREIELAKSDLVIAKKELAVAEATVDKAAIADDLGRERAENDEDDEHDDPASRDARAYRRWVEAKIELQEARVDEAEARLEYAHADRDLAAAELELMKAQKVAALRRPEIVLHVAEFERRVERREMAAGDARIAADSAAKRVELRDSVVRERAAAVPAQYRPK